MEKGVIFMNDKSNKKRMFLYIGCGLISLFFVVAIGVMTYRILSHMNSVSYDVDTITESYCQTELQSESNDASQIIETTIAQTNDAITTDMIEKETSVENDIAENDKISGKTPEVETDKDHLSYIVTYDDGRMAYIIQEGDTLSYVSTLLGYSVDTLAELNDIEDVNLIYAGSAIMIPQ